MPSLRGLPKDSPDVRYSKTIAYLLRHGAEKEGLPMRRDGYVKVHDLVSGAGKSNHDSLLLALTLLPSDSSIITPYETSPSLTCITSL